MDSKQKNATLKTRCKKLNQQIERLKSKRELAKLRAESLSKWSERLRRQSAVLDVVIDQLRKAI